MRSWRMTGEPSLDELLGDEIIDRVMERDGLDAAAIRRLLREMAQRLAMRPRQFCESVLLSDSRRRRGTLSPLTIGTVSTALRPGSLSSSQHAPAWSRATARTRLRPSPLPGVLRLPSRRTKRSNTASRRSAGTPGPVSATSTRAVSPSRARGQRDLARGRVFERVVEQIGDRLRQQVAVAAHRQASRRSSTARREPFSSATGS